MKNFYAIEWTNGRATNDKGERIGIYVRFRDEALRQNFVVTGNPCTSERGFREAIASTDPELKRLLKTATWEDRGSAAVMVAC